MAKYEDYVHLAQKSNEENAVDNEIIQASEQQEERETSTPDTDWQKRYKDLEVAYSRQGQQLGDYRQLVDGYVETFSTPEDKADDSQEVSPITPDDIYENPDEAVRRAVDSHPAIKRAQELEKELEQTRREAIMAEFNTRHPDFQETVKTPEFANWITEDQTRLELIKRADNFDMVAADALFTMYEAMNATPVVSDAELDQVSLESGSGAEAPAPETYSRREMLQIMTRAKQGDRAADEYYKAHAKSYRDALQAGNVRD